MPAELNDFNTAVRMHSVINSIASRAVKKLRPPARYGTVIGTVDPTTQKVQVRIGRETVTTPVTASPWNTPQDGSIVRVEGPDDDLFITAVMTGTLAPPPGGGGGGTDTGALHYKGNWSTGTAYVANDVVTFDQAQYLATAPSNIPSVSVIGHTKVTAAGLLPLPTGTAAGDLVVFTAAMFIPANVSTEQIVGISSAAQESHAAEIIVSSYSHTTAGYLAYKVVDAGDISAGGWTVPSQLESTFVFWAYVFRNADLGNMPPDPTGNASLSFYPGLRNDLAELVTGISLCQVSSTNTIGVDPSTPWVYGTDTFASTAEMVAIVGLVPKANITKNSNDALFAVTPPNLAGEQGAVSTAVTILAQNPPSVNTTDWVLLADAAADGDTTGGDNSIALGLNSAANNSDSVAVGNQATANFFRNVAIGYQAQTNGNSTVALGSQSYVDVNSTSAVALGSGSYASGENAVAIGTAFVGQHGGIGIGKFADVEAFSAIAIGDGAGVFNSGAHYAVAIGSGSDASYLNAIAIGGSAVAGAADALVVGSSSNASAGGATTVGSNASAAGRGAVAVGDRATASTEGAIAIGGQDRTTSGSYPTQASGNYSISIGQNARNSANYAIALGLGVFLAGANSIAVGYNVDLESSKSIAIGDNAGSNSTTNDNSVAIGVNAAAGGTRSIAIGETGAQVGATSIAIGYGAFSAFPGTLAAVADCVAIGTDAYVGDHDGIAIGNNAQGYATYAIGIGRNTSAHHAGSVAIGTDNAGTGAVSASANDFILGTALHKVGIPGELLLAAGTTAKPPMNIPHGAAPTTPANGDMWTTTAGLYVRINGSTIGPLS